MENSVSKNKPFVADYEKSVDWSISAIESFHLEAAYKVRLKGFPIDKAIATTIKTKEEGFCCKFFLEKLHDHTFNQNPQNFGILENILLERTGGEYLIKKDSMIKGTIPLSEPQVLTMQSKRLQQGSDVEFDNKLLRLAIPITEKIEIGIFEFKSIKIGTVYKPAGLVKVEVNNKNYHIFQYEDKNDKQRYLFIDCEGPCKFDEFKKSTKSILLGIGFITGNLIQNEYYFQVIEPDTITVVKNISYELHEKSIISNLQLFDPFRFSEYAKHYNRNDLITKFPLRFESAKFSKLCNLLNSNETVCRSVLLILEGNQSAFILLRSAIYSIALETLTNVVYEENKERINPINDKKLASTITKKMKGVIEEYDSFLNEYSKSILDSKINDLNNPTNSKKLSMPFEVLGLKLAPEDLLILNHRNKFLHGTSPFDESELGDKKSEVLYISKKIHFLLCALLLKYIGYSGHIINYPAKHQFYGKEKVTEHLYRII